MRRQVYSKWSGCIWPCMIVPLTCWACLQWRSMDSSTVELLRASWLWNHILHPGLLLMVSRVAVYAHWLLTNTSATYAPHLARQYADLQVFHADESLLLDPAMDYTQVKGLSEEVRERLQQVRPTTLVRISLLYLIIAWQWSSGCCQAHGRHDTHINHSFIETCTKNKAFQETDRLWFEEWTCI